MIKLNDFMKKWSVRVLFGEKSPDDYLAEVRDVFDKMLKVVKSNGMSAPRHYDGEFSISRQMKSIIVIEMSFSGDNREGSFRSFIFMSVNGRGFESMTIYDEEMEEVDTIEV